MTFLFFFIIFEYEEIRLRGALVEPISESCQRARVHKRYFKSFNEIRKVLNFNYFSIVSRTDTVCYQL